MLARSEWFLDDVGDFGSVVTQMKLQGRFIVELAELDALGRAEVTAMKEFLSRTEDSFRRPYAKFTERLPRRCVFVGTTNETVYLKDRTGNRRFWPIRCGRINLNRLAEDREQLFAEASHAFAQCEQYHLLPEMEMLAGLEQESRLLEEPWQDPVCEFISNKESVSINEVLESLGVMNSHQNPAHTKRVAALLQSIHWRRKRTNKGNRWVRTAKAEPKKPPLKMKFKKRSSKPE